jgi:acyl carrier protein
MLVLASERKFGIRFESSEIANAANVGEFVSLVESKLAR